MYEEGLLVKAGYAHLSRRELASLHRAQVDLNRVPTVCEEKLARL
jgi:hypothetical protein